jgi:hypothetical protein
MLNIDLSKYISTLGNHAITAIARGVGMSDSARSNEAIYSRLATVDVSENWTGGQTYYINTTDGGLTVDGGVYNINTAKEA